ncbi:GYD domain-containing protein [uncultured Nitratireductor sp.]|uniref:GYD domain-containing protein n=1 Tax=uncultured Nitratireductor sp. TaxID=520953 RepID=UPI0025FCB68D|nr:GYD domain-containing protein [uncultured Nitratireductor sp.]
MNTLEVQSESKLKFISLMKLTQKGLDELTDSARRREVSEQRVAAVGGRSIAFYAVLGGYDFVQIFEMPNVASMLQYVMTARRDGHVEPLLLPAFDTTEWSQILETFKESKE